MKPVGLIRRGLAGAIDGLASLGIIGLGFLTGTFDRVIFNPEPGWFYTEWWLKHWLDEPVLFTAPVLWWLIVWACWTVAWELASGRSLGARVARIEIVDGSGFEPGIPRLIVRAAGIALNTMTLGLTWLWGFVSPTRRCVTDYLSGTWVVSTQN